MHSLARRLRGGGAPLDDDPALSSSTRPRAALVQRSIPHYRIPLFEKLAADDRIAWSFYCGEHNSVSDSGLVAPLDRLAPQPIRHLYLPGGLVAQLGVPVNSAYSDALVADYGWTIVSNPWLFWLARRRGVATVGWTKGIAQDLRRSKSNLRRAFERLSLSLCDALVVYGETSRRYVEELGVSPDKVFVAQNTIDTRAIAASVGAARRSGEALKAQLGLDPRRPVVGYLGKVTKSKRVDAILHAFEAARALGCDAQLLIAGQGPFAAELDGQISASPYRSDIFRLADVPAGKEGSFFQAVDLVVSFAQAGLSLLEAMAHEKAIVSTPDLYPETELLADGETAFLCREATISSFAAAMRAALEDPASRRRVARNAQACVLQRASLESMVESISAAVMYAVEQRSRVRSRRVLC